MDDLEDARAELAALSASARALLAWEGEISGWAPPGGELVSKEPIRRSPAEEQDGAALAEVHAAPDDHQAEAPTTSVPAETRLRVLADEAAACTACRLHEKRTRSVFARGSASASLMFVGEGPGYNEDQQGLPFVGKAGQLLDRMIAAMGFAQDEIYVCNVVKCRPPDNRTPKADEALACRRYLEGQIQAVRPDAIVALGRCAAEHLGQLEQGPRGWRGRWGEFEGAAVMSTYHPAYLLRSPEQKKPVWKDLQAVVRKLGRSLPRR